MGKVKADVSDTYYLLEVYQFPMGKVKLNKMYYSWSRVSYQFPMGKVKLSMDFESSECPIWYQFPMGKVKPKRIVSLKSKGSINSLWER